MNSDVQIRTCAQEKHLVVSVCSSDLIHGHRGVFIAGVAPNHQGSPSHRVNVVKHDWMVADKVHHIIRELFSCVDVGCEGSTGALDTHSLKPLTEQHEKTHTSSTHSFFIYLYVELSVLPLVNPQEQTDM